MYISYSFLHSSSHNGYVIKIIDQARIRIPIVSCIVGESGYERKARDSLKSLRVPCYPTPEKAAKGLKALRLRAEYLEIPKLPTLRLSDQNKVKWLDRHLKIKALIEPYSCKLLSEYGILHPKSIVIRVIKELKNALEKINEPFVMKAVSPKLLHKTVVGGVILNLKREEAVS